MIRKVEVTRYFVFYLPQRYKVWIELLDFSDSLKYFIPSEPIWFPISNIYKIFDNNLIIIYIFDFIYLQDSKFGLNCWIWVIHLNISFLLSQCRYFEDPKFGLNCWIWVIHLNISFLLSQFDSLFQIFIQKKMELIRYFR